MAKKNKCNNCGFTLTGTELFCKSCGQKIESQPPLNPNTNNELMTYQTNTPQSNKPKSLTKFFVTLAIITVLVISACFLYISGSFDDIKDFAENTISNFSSEKDIDEDIIQDDETEEEVESEQSETAETLVEEFASSSSTTSENVETDISGSEEALELKQAEAEKIAALELEVERLEAEKLEAERLEALRIEEELKESLKNELKAEIEAELKAELASLATPTPAPVISYDYILQSSSSQYLTSSDIQFLSSDQLRLARNEIFARHGRTFQSQDLQTYFNSKSWYTPISANIDLVDLTAVERANVELIQAEEARR